MKIIVVINKLDLSYINQFFEVFSKHYVTGQLIALREDLETSQKTNPLRIQLTIRNNTFGF